jgi:hypothetical protein
MYKKKKIKTIIVEKYNNGENGNHEIKLYPDLLGKLFWYVRTEAKSDEQTQAMVNRMRLMMLDEDCLDLEAYEAIITEPASTMVSETPAA